MLEGEPRSEDPARADDAHIRTFLIADVRQYLHMPEGCRGPQHAPPYARSVGDEIERSAFERPPLVCSIDPLDVDLHALGLRRALRGQTSASRLNLREESPGSERRSYP
jgi:hypothetical protein